MEDYQALQLELKQQRGRVEYLEDCCKNYLQGYEKSKRSIDQLSLENERLKARINDLKAMSIAKEANFEIIAHLENLDYGYYQETIQSIQRELVVLKQENEILRSINLSNGIAPNQLKIIIKDHHKKIILENNHLYSITDTLRREIHEINDTFNDLQGKYGDLLNKQLEKAKILVQKDEEIRFWKSTLIELICGEVLKNFKIENEFKSIIDSNLEFPEKFLRIKDKLEKCMKLKQPVVLSSDSEALISEKSFIIACSQCSLLVNSLIETLFDRFSEVCFTVYKDLKEKVEVRGSDINTIIDSLFEVTKNSSQSLISFSPTQNICVLDIHKSNSIIKSLFALIFDQENLPTLIRQSFIISESIYIIVD